MKNLTKLSLLTVLLAALLFTSCKKEYDTIETVDDAAIQTYIKSNSLSMTKASTGYYYNVITPGTGAVIKNSDSIYYSYTFKLLNGTVINKTSDVMIPGIYLGYTDRFVIGSTSYLFTPVREVLTMLKRGGTARLIMPSNLAFGKNGLSTINVGSNENILVELGIYTQTKRYEVDELEINNFLTANKLIATKDPSRVRYIVTQQGTGSTPISSSSSLVVNYTGRLLDGTVFDSGTASTFVLSETIKGWAILNKFTAGTKVRLFIPSDLGYGASGNGIIPGNVALDFDIEIVSVTN